jgi:hypothetical protein
MSKDDEIVLNVGGSRYTTSRKTLLRSPDTMFASMLSGRWNVPVESDGSVFIDRDGDAFRHVLEYLEGGTLAITDMVVQKDQKGAFYRQLRQLDRELKYYSIELKPVELTFVLGGLCKDILAYKKEIRSTVSCKKAGGQWRKASPMTHPRSHFATCVSNGFIYTLGGCDELANISDSTHVYNPVVDKWYKRADMPEARWFHEACAVDGSIYVIGGHNEWDELADQADIEAARFNTFLRYNIAQNEWSTLPTTVNASLYSKVCTIENIIYIFDFSGRILYRYDTATDAWLHPLTVPLLMQHNQVDAVCVLGSTVYIVGRVYAFGPHKQYDSENMLASFSSFNTATGLWEKLPSPWQTIRDSHPALFTTHGKIHFTGGVGAPCYKSSGLVDIYDTIKAEWISVEQSGLLLQGDATRIHTVLVDPLQHAYLQFL